MKQKRSQKFSLVCCLRRTIKYPATFNNTIIGSQGYMVHLTSKHGALHILNVNKFYKNVFLNFYYQQYLHIYFLLCSKTDNKGHFK